MCDVWSICRKSGASSVFAIMRGRWCCTTHPGGPKSKGMRRRCCSGGNPCSATRRLCWRSAVIRKRHETTNWRSPALSPPGRRCASLSPRTSPVAAVRYLSAPSTSGASLAARVASASLASACARNAWMSRSVIGLLCRARPHNLLYASHFPGCESDLHAARVEGRFREDIFYNTASEFSGTLVLLLRDVDAEPWLDVFPVLSVHALASFAFRE